MNFQKVIFFDGDTHIKGDLNQPWTKAILKTLGKGTDEGDTLILVNGNLTVAGTIKPTEDSFPFLLVIGNVQCEVLQNYDECIYITGDADITYAFDGNYNDGSITIGGITRVPYVLNSNHSFSITPEGAILINYFGDDDDFFEYDYTNKDLERVMVPAVFDKKKSFSQFSFIELLKAGKSPLKKGVRPARQMVQEEIAQLSSGKAKIEELDLSEKKLKEFSNTLTTVTTLKKLVLNDNPIGNIPAEIKDLVNLEELHLDNCGLESLPVEIGLLQHLRVLHISRNVGFELPASVAGLKNLEELACNQCSWAAPIEFPEALIKLSGLKRLLMGKNSIKSIPESFLELQNLEELNLDASLGYLDELPDLSKLKNLKTLRANGLIGFGSIPYPKQSLLRSFFQITSLEALYIDRHGKRKEGFISKELLAEIEQNLAHDPERFKAYTAGLTVKPNQFKGDGWTGIIQEALKAEHLEGISNLQHLKVLDLSCNGLTSLPKEMAALKNLKELNLCNNSIPATEQKKIARSLPGCKIDFSDNR
jgi:Leucine-rich repeat (LRR) protein